MPVGPTAFQLQTFRRQGWYEEPFLGLVEQTHAAYSPMTFGWYVAANTAQSSAAIAQLQETTRLIRQRVPDWSPREIYRHQLCSARGTFAALHFSHGIGRMTGPRLAVLAYEPVEEYWQWLQSGFAGLAELQAYLARRGVSEPRLRYPWPADWPQ